MKVNIGEDESRTIIGHQQLYEIGVRAFNTGYDDGQFIKGYKTDIGAFEVYFMGVKLFSKLICNKWPRISSLA